MKVRRPNLDFSDTPAHWADNHEFAQSFNGSSLWIPYLERFLNRVLARVQSRLKDSARLTTELRADIRTFIRQESNHYSMHDAFNTVLGKNGYDVGHFIAHFEREFERLFETKSLAFLMAYCEGFETLGPPSAIVWLDEMEDMIAGARTEVVTLWKWHLMEEYEHRTVCYDVFRAVHGGYFLRLYGFFYQLRHLQGFSRMVREYLLETDRAGMTADERRASIRREKANARRMAARILPRLLKVLSPFYTPRRAREPAEFESYRDSIEAGLA